MLSCPDTDIDPFGQTLKFPASTTVSVLAFQFLHRIKVPNVAQDDGDHYQYLGQVLFIKTLVKLPKKCAMQFSVIF